MIAAAALLSLAIASVPAPSPAAEAAPVILERIELVGNRHTSAAYVESVLGLEPGEPFDLAEVPALEQRLRNLGIFSEVRIVPAVTAAGVVLHVQVREKWTLFFVPALAISGGVFTAGGLVLDSSLLGEGKQLAVGGLGSNRGAGAFVMYRDPSIGFSRWLLNLRAGVSDARRERFEGRSLAYRFRDRRVEAVALGGYHLDQRWSLEAGWFLRLQEARRSSGFDAPPRAGPVHGPAVSVELAPTRLEDYLALGVAGNLEVRRSLRLGSGARQVDQAFSTVTWTARAWRDHGVSVELLLDHARGDSVLDAVRLGGAPGSRGFPAEGLWAMDTARLALEYQVPFWRPGWGVLTAVGLADVGALRWRGQGKAYAAPGIGLRVYLRNVVAPVLGFDLAWATGERAPVPSVQLGFRG